MIIIVFGCLAAFRVIAGCPPTQYEPLKGFAALHPR